MSRDATRVIEEIVNEGAYYRLKDEVSQETLTDRELAISTLSSVQIVGDFRDVKLNPALLLGVLGRMMTGGEKIKKLEKELALRNSPDWTAPEPEAFSLQGETARVNRDWVVWFMARYNEQEAYAYQAAVNRYAETLPVVTSSQLFFGVDILGGRKIITRRLEELPWVYYAPNQEAEPKLIFKVNRLWIHEFTAKRKVTLAEATDLGVKAVLAKMGATDEELGNLQGVTVTGDGDFVFGFNCEQRFDSPFQEIDYIKQDKAQ